MGVRLEKHWSCKLSDIDAREYDSTKTGTGGDAVYMGVQVGKLDDHWSWRSCGIHGSMTDNNGIHAHAARVITVPGA